MTMPSEASACERCLRRAWLLDLLAGSIATIADDRRGFRAEELLALSDEDLIATTAGEHAHVVSTSAGARGADAVAAAIAETGAWSVCEHCHEYPPVLRDLGEARPRALICHGDRALLERLTPSGAVAVVGARKCSRYGEGRATELGQALAANGLVVVSGMAFGIDAKAHTGALEAGGSTVAVLAGGCDVAYPTSNVPLYRRIREHGLVLSEMPPRANPHRWSFPARNRTIAALAGMTIVVQATTRSGSLITARHARELGRDVGAVAGNVDNSLSTGANALIADGAALIRGADDVLDALLGPGSRPAKSQRPRLDDKLEAALKAVGQGATTADAVAERAGLDGRAVAIALSRLELLGYIGRSSSGTYARTALAGDAS
jgi:DNA processing protein